MSNVKERPIILNAQEVNAVLADNKTQHRMPFDFEFKINTASLNETADDIGWSVQKLITRAYHEAVYDFECPFGDIGDRLWVQEPTLAIEDVGWIGPVFVASDNGRNAIDWGYGPYDDPAHIPACELTYNKPCDLSYEDSRILLQITDIRIERVQDISGVDAYAEGCPYAPANTHHASNQVYAYRNASSWFAENWKEQHGEQSYLGNDWVWVIEFKVIKES